MSFDFVMDAFPAYTKFDKTHKCLCALQVIGGDQGEAADEAVSCPPIEDTEYPVTEVVAGYREDLWKVNDVKTALKLPEDAEQDDVKALLEQFGRNFSADMSALDIDFHGVVVSGVDTDIDIESDGYYIPVALKTTAVIQDIDNEGNTVPVLDKDGNDVGDMSIKSGDWKLILYAIDQNNPVQSIKVGDTYYAFDFSNINFA